jgi:hypothetical protein
MCFFNLHRYEHIYFFILPLPALMYSSAFSSHRHDKSFVFERHFNSQAVICSELTGEEEPSRDFPYLRERNNYW